jgi:hypothetical protein
LDGLVVYSGHVTEQIQNSYLPMLEGPEKKFQRHMANYFIRKHRYALFGQDIETT